MRRFLILVLLLSTACGGTADSPESTYLEFIGAGAEGRWADWAALLDPEVREATAAMVAGWLQFRSVGTAVEAEARTCLESFGLVGAEGPTVTLEEVPDLRAFLAEAIPILLRGAGAEEAEFRSILLPPGDELRLVQVTGDTARGIAVGGAVTRRIFFRRVEGSWRIFSF